MTPAQLAVAEAAEIISREVIEEKHMDATGALNLHKKVLQEVTGNIGYRIKNKILENPQKLSTIRREQKQMTL